MPRGSTVTASEPSAPTELLLAGDFLRRTGAPEDARHAYEWAFRISDAASDCGIGTIASIMTVPMALEDAVRDGRALLSDAAARSIRLLLLGAAVASRSEERFREGLAS